MMQSWLACWIFSIPTDGATDPEQLAARAVYPPGEDAAGDSRVLEQLRGGKRREGQAERELLHLASASARPIERCSNPCIR